MVKRNVSVHNEMVMLYLSTRSSDKLDFRSNQVKGKALETVN